MTTADYLSNVGMALGLSAGFFGTGAYAVAVIRWLVACDAANINMNYVLGSVIAVAVGYCFIQLGVLIEKAPSNNQATPGKNSPTLE